MGQATVKATRRALRRAVGPAALGTIQAQEQAIAILQNGLVSSQRELAALAVGLTDLRRQHADALGALGDDVVSTQADIASLTTFRTRGLRDRLRWVLTGR